MKEITRIRTIETTTIFQIADDLEESVCNADSRELDNLAYEKILKAELGCDDMKLVKSQDFIRDVFPPHRIHEGDCGVTKCSACQNSIEECVDYAFCPFCGAKMTKIK